MYFDLKNIMKKNMFWFLSDLGSLVGHWSLSAGCFVYENKLLNYYIFGVVTEIPIIIWKKIL